MLAASLLGISTLVLPSAAAAATGGSPVVDASTWTGVTAPTEPWYSVAYGDGVWVAVADSAVMRSTDGGQTWSTSGITGVPSNGWISVAYGNGVWIAVSWDGTTDQVMRSTDGGLTWAARQATAARAWRGVAYGTDGSGNGVWIAVAYTGTSGQVMRSTDDGVTWTNTGVAGVPTNRWYGVAHSGGAWVAVGRDTTNPVIRSVDGGLTWSTTGITGVPTADWVSVANGGGSWVAVATARDGGSQVMRSADGLTWTAASAPEANTWLTAAYGDGVWVAVSSNGTRRLMRSLDGGATWEGILVPDGQWRSVAYGTFGASVPAWVAVGEGGTYRAMRGTA